MASTLKDSLLHWRKKLDRTTDENAILSTIHKLSKVPITVDLLQDTGIGKSIRNLAKKSGKVGTKASSVLQNWRDVVASTPKNSEASPKLEHTKHSHKRRNNSSDEKQSPDKSRKQLQYEEYKKSKHSSDSSRKEKHARDHSKHTSDHSKHLTPKLSHSSKKKHDPRSISSDYVHKEKYEKDLDLGKHAKFLEITKEHSQKRKADKTMQNSTSDPKKPKKEYAEILDIYDEKKYKEFSASDDLSNLIESSIKLPPIEKRKHKQEVDQNLNDIPKEKKRKYEDIQLVPKTEVVYNSDCTSKKKDKEKKSHKSSNHNDLDKSRSKKNKESKKKAKSNQNTSLNIVPTEAFTSSEARFEDCLSFNDIVTVKKKKSSKSTSEKKGKHAIKKEIGEKAVLKNSLSTSKSKHNEIVKTENLSVPELLTPNLNGVNIVSTLPRTQPNYRPLPQRSYDGSGPSKKKVLSNEDAIKFTSSRREKTSVYSGKKIAFTYTEVPTLVDCCIRILIDNIDAIEYIGGAVPYFLLKHVLIRCSAAQLHNIEDFNPYLLDETQELWETHCKKDFRNYKRQDNETWRDLYWRATEEREKKLKSLTENIVASRVGSTPSGRRVQLAYVDSVVKPPRDVARKQAKHGTALPVNHVVKAGPPSKATPRPIAPTINSAASHSREFVPKKPKVAPLMAKTLKSMKQCFRR